jgi:hypothetical protein
VTGAGKWQMLIQSVATVDSILESAIDHYLKFFLFCNATRKLSAAVDPVNHMVYAMDTGAGKMVGLKYDSSKIFHIPLGPN